MWNEYNRRRAVLWEVIVRNDCKIGGVKIILNRVYVYFNPKLSKITSIFWANCGRKTIFSQDHTHDNGDYTNFIRLENEYIFRRKRKIEICKKNRLKFFVDGGGGPVEGERNRFLWNYTTTTTTTLISGFVIYGKLGPRQKAEFVACRRSQKRRRRGRTNQCTGMCGEFETNKSYVLRFSERFLQLSVRRNDVRRQKSQNRWGKTNIWTRVLECCSRWFR